MSRICRSAGSTRLVGHRVRPDGGPVRDAVGDGRQPRPRRALLVASLLGYALCNAVTAFSDSYPLTFAARMVGGLTRVFWGMLGGYVGRIVPPERVGRALTLLSAGGTAVLFGVPAGTAPAWPSAGGRRSRCARWWRWRWRCSRSVCCHRWSGSAAVATMRLRQVVRLPGLAVPVIVTGVTMLGHFSFSTYVAPFLLRAGLSEAGIGPALAASGLLGVLGLVATGALVAAGRGGRPWPPRPRWSSRSPSSPSSAPSAVPAVVAGASTRLALGGLPVLLQTATLRAAPQAAEQAISTAGLRVQCGHRRWWIAGRRCARPLGGGALLVLACALTAVGFAVIAFNPGPAPAPVAAV